MSTRNTITSLAMGISLSFAAGSSLALAAGPATADEDHSSSMTEAVSDTWITTKVKTELATSKGVSSTDISVTTVDGKVTLTGVLSSKAEIDKAVTLTRSIEGVHDVDAAGLKVGDPAKVEADDAYDHDDDDSRSVGDVVDDSWITTKVKADLAVTEGVPSAAISVKTVDGVVSLSGSLPSELALKKAVSVARAIKGVRQVDATALVVEK